MKKIIALLLALVMVFALVACAAKTDAPAEETKTEEPAATETTTTEETAEPAAEETAEPAAEEGKAKGVKGLPMKLGMEMAAEMIAKIKDEHLCDGVHIMAIGAEKNVPAILDLAGITI